MSKLIAAHTTLAPVYPGYVNVSRDDDGAVIVTVRGDPAVMNDASHICGQTVTVRLSADDWKALSHELAKGA